MLGIPCPRHLNTDARETPRRLQSFEHVRSKGSGSVVGACSASATATWSRTSAASCSTVSVTASGAGGEVARAFRRPRSGAVPGGRALGGYARRRGRVRAVVLPARQRSHAGQSAGPFRTSQRFLGSFDLRLRDRGAPWATSGCTMRHLVLEVRVSRSITVSAALTVFARRERPLLPYLHPCRRTL
jgi:hypothetical protein